MLMNKFFLASLLLLTFITNVEATSEQEQIARSEYPTDTLYKIWLDQQKDEDAALKFYNALSEKHLIELDQKDTKLATVTYFAKGSADTDYIMQSGGPDRYGLRFKRLAGSDVFYCVQQIPRDAWFVYGINEFRIKAVKGAANLLQTSTEHIADGVVIGPTAPLSNLIKSKPAVPRGTLREVMVASKALGEKRKIEVYLPAGYNPKVAHHLLLQFDGQNYSATDMQRPEWEGWTPLPTILDNLIHQQKIGPTVAIFIHNQGNRSGDLINDKMADFVALELVSWARDNFNISANSKSIVVSGPSRAGFAAANTAFRHADIVGSVLSQSGSFYFTLQEQENWPVYPEFEGKLLHDYKTAAQRDIQFYLDVGLYDLGLGAVGTNRQLRDVLELKGYQVDYYQYKGGHSHLGWRHTIGKGLISLLGKENANNKLQRTGR
jgi:enterochelin esterase family protein